MIPVTTFAGKTVAVFGLGASGVASAKALLAGGAEVAAWDDSEASRAAAEREGVSLRDLRDADWSRFAALVLAPGVPLTHPGPHWTVKAAKAAGVEVIGDVELFCREWILVTKGFASLSTPFIAVTGTNGKSTTTALIAHILRLRGFDVQMGGNIGTPILALEPPQKGKNSARPRRVHVIECSSFQIDLAPSLKPTFGVLLNITPDHLDRHGTFENYTALKERLVDSSLYAVIGLDDGPSRAIFERQKNIRASQPNEAPPWAISGEGLIENGLGAEGTCIVHGSGERMKLIVDLAGIPSLRGAHNRQNAAAAIAVTSLMQLVDFVLVDGKYEPILPDWNLAQELASFPGLPHRMEEIGRAGRVLFINDSKATNADSTEKALLSWDGDIFWIAGGRAKEGGVEPLKPLVPRVAKAYLIGESSEAFATTLSENGVAFEKSGTLDVAVASAARDAAQSAGAEPVVLLSPACASYDQFKNFEVRGDAFRRLVAALPGVDIKKPDATPSARERGEGPKPDDALDPAPHPLPMNGERGSHSSPEDEPSDGSP